MEILFDNHLNEFCNLLEFSTDKEKNIFFNEIIFDLKNNLREYYDNNLLGVQVFGSYNRGTLISNKFNFDTDIDIMILFKSFIKPNNPERYRNSIFQFAKEFYPNFRIYKDLPTVVLKFDKFNLDLVPTIYEKDFFGNDIYKKIPGQNNTWQFTDPDQFERKVSIVFKKNNAIKPIIRFLKYWNMRNSYPFSSYNLEDIISNMQFENNSISKVLFEAIDQLPVTNLPYSAYKKVITLKSNKNWIEIYLKSGNVKMSLFWLNKIIPTYATI